MAAIVASLGNGVGMLGGFLQELDEMADDTLASYVSHMQQLNKDRGRQPGAMGEVVVCYSLDFPLLPIG